MLATVTFSGALVSPAWSSGATLCTTTISGTAVKGPLIVPAGASCFLADVTVSGNAVVQGGGSLFIDYQSGSETTTIMGNLTVGAGGSLSTDSGTTVDGNLVSTHAQDNLKFTSIHGNLLITGATGALSGMQGGSVGGNAVFASNSAQFVGEVGTTFGGSVSFWGNTSVLVLGGSVAANLFCVGNGSVSDAIPFPPFTAVPVAVGGHAFGQCAPPISVLV